MGTPMTKWYYLDGGATGGPVDDDELRRLAAIGRLQPGSHVTPVGATQWFTAADYEAHLGIRYGTPPPPGGSPAADRSVSDDAAIGPALVQAAFGPALADVTDEPVAATPGPVALRPGALWRRFLAIVLDAVLFGVPALVLCLTLGGITVLDDSSRTNYRIEGSGVLLVGILGVLYFGVLTGLWGRTPGKTLTDLRVVDLDDGGSIGVVRGVGRFMAVVGLLALCIVPAVVDAIWAIFDREHQALHDKLMDSVVVRAPHRSTVSSSATMPVASLPSDAPGVRQPVAVANAWGTQPAVDAQTAGGRSETRPNSDSPSPSS
jgi:uncharacterized RDD family membrane protein YckC